MKHPVTWSLAVLAALAAWAIPASAENWPQFRGPTGQGISTEKGLPTRWSPTENVAWKTPIPGEGWSSPIVWGDRVFVTAATDTGKNCHVLCLDRKTGKVLWDKQVFQQTTVRIQKKNSDATPTPVTDGQRVYAFFGGGGAVALDFDGNVVWTNTENKFYSQHGLGSSPTLYKDVLIMPWDHSIRPGPGIDPKTGWQIPWEEAFVLGLDKNTGKELYKAKRGKSRISHMTPHIVEVDGKPQLISAAGDVINAFDPETGKPLWHVRTGGEGVTPSPVFGDGVVYSSSGFPTNVPYAAIRAHRMGGSGDVTEKNLLWEQKKAVPMLPSFVLANGLLFTVKENGIAQCLDPKTGEEIWTQRLEGTYSASPVATADGRIYLISEQGDTLIFEAARAFKEIATNPLEGQVQASPAVSQGQIFIRTEKNLYCIGTGASAARQ